MFYGLGVYGLGLCSDWPGVLADPPGRRPDFLNGYELVVQRVQGFLPQPWIKPYHGKPYNLFSPTP